MVTLKISRVDSEVKLPAYESESAAGMDLRAFLPAESSAGTEGRGSSPDVLIHPMARVRIPTGLRIEIPEGYEGQIRPRSGLALKFGVTVLNSPGTIDSDYRGDVDVILVNLGAETFIVKNGDRIAQLVIAPVTRADLAVKTELSETARGDGGFGSTGV